MAQYRVVLHVEITVSAKNKPDAVRQLADSISNGIAISGEEHYLYQRINACLIPVPKAPYRLWDHRGSKTPIKTFRSQSEAILWAHEAVDGTEGSEQERMCKVLADFSQGKSDAYCY